MSEDQNRGQFITKSRLRADVRRRMKENDPNCYNVELYECTPRWRFIE